MRKRPFRVKITLFRAENRVKSGGVIRRDRGVDRRVIAGNGASARGIILIPERFRLLRPRDVRLIRAAARIEKRRSGKFILAVRDLEIAVRVRKRQRVTYRSADRRRDVTQKIGSRIGVSNRRQFPGKRGSQSRPKIVVERRFGVNISVELSFGVVQRGARLRVVSARVCGNVNARGVSDVGVALKLRVLRLHRDDARVQRSEGVPKRRRVVENRVVHRLDRDLRELRRDVVRPNAERRGRSLSRREVR